MPRAKPFKYAYEKEIVLYAYFRRLDYFSTECVYAPNAYRSCCAPVTAAHIPQRPCPRPPQGHGERAPQLHSWCASAVAMETQRPQTSSGRARPWACTRASRCPRSVRLHACWRQSRRQARARGAGMCRASRCARPACCWTASAAAPHGTSPPPARRSPSPGLPLARVMRDEWQQPGGGLIVVEQRVLYVNCVPSTPHTALQPYMRPDPPHRPLHPAPRRPARVRRRVPHRAGQMRAVRGATA